MKQTHLLLLIGILLFLCYCNRDKIEAFGIEAFGIEAFGNQLIVPQFEFAILTPNQDPMSGYFQEEVCRDDPEWRKGDKKCIDYSMDRNNCIDKGENGKSAMDACPVSCDSCPSSVKIKRRLPSPVEDVEEPDYAVFEEVMNLSGGMDSIDYREIYERLDDINDRLDGILSIEEDKAIEKDKATFICTTPDPLPPQFVVTRENNLNAGEFDVTVACAGDYESEQMSMEDIQANCSTEVAACECEAELREALASNEPPADASPQLQAIIDCAQSPSATPCTSSGPYTLSGCTARESGCTFAGGSSEVLDNCETLTTMYNLQCPSVSTDLEECNNLFSAQENRGGFDAKEQCFSGSGMWSTCKQHCCDNYWFPFPIQSPTADAAEAYREWYSSQATPDLVDVGSGSSPGSAAGAEACDWPDSDTPPSWWIQNLMTQGTTVTDPQNWGSPQDLHLNWNDRVNYDPQIWTDGVRYFPCPGGSETGHIGLKCQSGEVKSDGLGCGG